MAGSNKRHTGDCYQANGSFFMDTCVFSEENRKKYRLVHGTALGRGSIAGIPHGHCWVECDNLVLDHSNGKDINDMPKELYYAIGHITDVKEYAYEEFRTLILKHGHWGPW